MIWPRIYFSCFFLVCFCSLKTLSFCEWAFVGFLLLSKYVFFLLSCFSLTTIDSQRTLYLAFGMVGMHSATASMWVVTKFSYLSFGVCFLMSPEQQQTFLTVTKYWLFISLFTSENQSYSEALFISLLLLLTQENLCWDHSVTERYSFKRGVCLTVQSSVHLLPVHKHII